MRQNKYLNNIFGQDHRAIKRITRVMLGFKSFWSARITIAGIETMHMIKKGQMACPGGQTMSAANQFYSLGPRSPAQSSNSFRSEPTNATEPEKGRLKKLSAKSRMTQWRQSDYFSKPSCRIAACTAGRAAMRSRKAAMLASPVMSIPTRGAELVTAKR